MTRTMPKAAMIPSRAPAAAAMIPSRAPAAAACVLLALGGCGPDLDSVPRISVQELHRALQMDEAVVVDVRSRGSYDAGHIKGAVSMPLSEITGLSSALPRDRLIATYCT